MEHVNLIIMVVSVYHLIHSKENGIISTMDIVPLPAQHLVISNLMTEFYMKIPSLVKDIHSHLTNSTSHSVLMVYKTLMVSTEILHLTMHLELMSDLHLISLLGSIRMSKNIQLFLSQLLIFQSLPQNQLVLLFTVFQNMSMNLSMNMQKAMPSTVG